ncbi:MAG: DUF11 domain-containing protein [Anaerolineae bacterium]|nr:DUF11 domain-containing protein [Anaerolineae bacterium]
MQSANSFGERAGLVAVTVALGLLAALLLVLPTVARGTEGWTSNDADNPPITVNSSHALSLAKLGSSDQVQAGGPLSYTIFYTVTGNEPAPNVVITDAVPLHTTFQSCEPACAANGSVVTWTLGTLPPGSGQVSMAVLVNSPLLSGTLLTNNAWISDDDGERASVTETTWVTASPGTPELVVSKSVTPLAVRPGDIIEYTIVVSNEGTGTAAGVDIMDNLPSGFYPSSWQWTNQTVGDEWTRTFQAAAAVIEGIYSNLVTVTWESNTSTTGPTAPILVDSTPPNSTLVELPAAACAGALLDMGWTAADALSGVDSIALWYRISSGSWQQSELSASDFSGNPVTGRFQFQLIHGAGVYYFETIATDAVGNEEPRSGGDGDAAMVVRTCTVYLPVVLKSHSLPAPDLSDSTKVAQQVLVEPGQAVDYTIVLMNSGTAHTSFAFYDPIPIQTSFDSVTAPCTHSAGGNRIEWSGTLAPGSSAQCQFSVRVNPDALGMILNTAQVYDGYHAEPLGLRAEVAVPSWHRGLGLLPETTVYSIAACPTISQILYAGTNQYGVWKSEDGGTTWTQAGIPGELVRSVAIAPDSACQVVYATTWGSGVWKSTDAGASWSATNSGLSDLYLYAVTADAGGVVYLGTSEAGVFKSEDAGATWASSSDGMPSTALVYTLATDPTDPETLYAGTWGNGVFESENSAASWSAINAGLVDPLNIYNLAVQPATPGTLYAATEQHGLYRWDTGTAQWVNEWGPDRVAYSVAVDAAGTAYLGTDGQNGDGLWRRSLAGVWEPLWTQIDTNPAIRAIAIPSPACTPDRLLWLGTTDGAWWYGAE